MKLQLWIIAILTLAMGEVEHSTAKLVKFKIEFFNQYHSFHTFNRDSFYIIQALTDSIVFQSKINDNERPVHSIKTLPVGHYKLVFANHYHQKDTFPFELRESTIAPFKICLDCHKKFPNNTLQKLKDNDSIVLNIETYGCFGSRSLNCVFKKEGGQFIAKLYRYDINYKKVKKSYQKIVSKDTLIKKLVMNDSDIQFFQQFEKDLVEKADNGLCTTNTYYNFQSKYFNYFVTDGQCKWNGDSKLLTRLFQVDF